jgi:predicted GTPase
MSELVSRNDMLADFANLAKEFDTALINAKEQERVFNKICIDFHDTTNRLVDKAINDLSTENPLYSQISTFANHLKTINNKWEQDIATKDKGVKFREGFNDSLLIFVYGKVKSGKSSLGNYVAWGNTDPTDEVKLNTPANFMPKFFSGEKTNVKNGDAEKEAEKNKEFRVGATEATSSIQGFSLPGLTWVDSPGLHSVNEENGKLAKDYVEQSDLILYTMKSDSPGRSTDLEEIKELYKSGKRLILLVTGSDDTKPSVENGKVVKKIIMKDEKRRADQRAYIRQQLNLIPELKENAENIEIISFSARYAQLNSDNANEFMDSGMGGLFAEIKHTATTEGVRLKKQVPLKAFASFLNGFISDLDKLDNSIEQFEHPIKQLKQSIPLKLNTESANLERHLLNLIRTEFNEMNQVRDDSQQVNNSIKNLVQKLNTIQIQEMQRIHNDIISEVANEFNENLNSVATIMNLEIPDFNIETKDVKEASGHTKGNKSMASGLGALAGGLVGGLVGGPLGSAVGASLGGLVGGALGNDAEVTYTTRTVTTGDNLSQIQHELSHSIRSNVKKQIKNLEIQTLDIAVGGGEKLVRDISQTLNKTKTQFKDLQQSIQKQIV